jgi:hypothetical protein
LFPELTDEVGAYRVQAENTSHSLAASRRLVGRKDRTDGEGRAATAWGGRPGLRDAVRRHVPQRRSIIKSIEVRAIPSGHAAMLIESAESSGTA